MYRDAEASARPRPMTVRSAVATSADASAAWGLMSSCRDYQAWPTPQCGHVTEAVTGASNR
jgi:hypothetical protein